jgi:hypothetical protein
MRDILDPSARWLGTPGGAQVAGNKRPVTVDDTLSLLMDSGPVSVTVLANDFDPEGASLTLISATAGLGTAVAETNNTVTYTPPPGVTGFDTVIYEVADDLDQRRTGQIDVTITEPVLSVETAANNTLVINSETGSLDITVTTPAVFAGTWSIDTNDLNNGPVNLVPPAFSGTVAIGEVLTATEGLWVYDTSAGLPDQFWQWRRAGQEIPGATGATYTVTSADYGPGLSVAETMSDANGQRSAVSAIAGATYLPSDDGQLLGWWDAADTATILESGGQVYGWADKAGGANLTQANLNWRPSTGARVLNGLNVLDFEGEFMEGSRSFPASGDMAFHAVFVVDQPTNAFAALVSVEATNDFQLDANNSAQFDGRLNTAGIGTPVLLSGGPFSGAFIVSVMFDRTGASQAEVFIANTSRGSTGYSAPIDANAALHVMTNRSKNAWIDGALAELIVTGDVSNRADHHAYLATKWGLN